MEDSGLNFSRKIEYLGLSEDQNEISLQGEIG